ncbi:ABC transporter permease [Ferrimicrobium acidiphilum]|uniref:ABC transporter permease n=1 Tax=Ferrimicrobium acidiphilum TaxID=121039 RepID=UPI0023F4AC5C|nr:ABC transporter permease [Ferrimicrobium acidiphilum]
MTAMKTEQPSTHAAAVDQRMGALRAAFSTFIANKLAVGSLVILILIILFCFIGPLVYHTNQVSAQLLLENQAPSSTHILGTSPTGRDELGRLMLGGQSTIELGLAVGVLASAFGLVWGTISGFVGGLVDSVMMRIVDALLSIPFLFFVILLASIVRPTLWLIILVISGVSWLSTARLVRGETLSLKTRDYVVAASGFGAPRWRLIARHIMPNVLGVLVVNGTLKVADAILTFAALGYLGLSIPPPATNWGEILAGGVNNIFDGYWWQLWPAAVLIVLTVLAVNVLGDALRDVVEARLAQR